MAAPSLEERVNAIELRLARIETHLNPPSQARVTPQANPRPERIERAIIAPTIETPTRRTGITRSGNWLGLIAVACFVMAAGFIIKLSIDTGWLTPERQIGLAALLGFALIAAGFALMEKDRGYASLLPGAGIIVLYLTIVAAHTYYALIPFEVAIALTSIVSLFCVWIYTQIEHDAYAITAAAGSYVTPAILGVATDPAFSLYYFLFCSVAFAVISVWIKSRTLTLVSSYLALLMTGLIGIPFGNDTLVASLLAIHFIVFAVATYLYTLTHKEPLSEFEALSFLPVLFLFYCLEYFLLERINPTLAPWISLGFAAGLMGLYLSARHAFADGLASQSLIFAFVTLAVFHSVYLELLPADVRPWLFVAILLAFTFSPFALDRTKLKQALWIPALALLAVLAIEYLGMLSDVLSGRRSQKLLVSFAALASTWATLTMGKDKLASVPTAGHVLLGAAHVLAVAGLFRLMEDFGSLAISASWLLYAAAVVGFAFVRRDEIMAKSALMVLAFAAAKALLVDAASAPSVVRIFCLLLTGVVLYGCGLLMRRIGSWAEGQEKR